jgi:hypothetical protein
LERLYKLNLTLRPVTTCDSATTRLRVASSLSLSHTLLYITSLYASQTRHQKKQDSGHPVD